MPRSNRAVDTLIPAKVRKRGSSPAASSSSSIVQHYRFKRAILIGKRGGSTTPMPTWRLMSSRSPSLAQRTMESPQFSPSRSGKGKLQEPVSARKLAATLWEMNEMPSPRVREGLEGRRLKKEGRGRERVASSVRSGSLPPHLSDPSHSPVSERMDRSGTGSHRRRSSSFSQRLRVTEQNGGALGSISNGSLMETENKSLPQTPHGQIVGVKTRLKDVSNALTTSKELLKIINRMWGPEDRPSSSMSVMSALHAELERARLMINQVIQEQRSEQSEINYLMKCFAEEKAAWRSKERKVVEAAIESVVGELEVERKLRARIESLNKKLGKELAESKASLLKAVQELESEKRAREIIEQVCDELAGTVAEEKDEAEAMRRETLKIHEEIEKEREIMQLADVTREDRVQMKHPEASEEKEDDGGDIEDGIECKEDSAETEEEMKARKSTSGRAPRRSTSLQRSISDGVEWGIQTERFQNGGNELDWEKLQVEGYGDEMHAYKLVKGLRDRMLYGPTTGSPRALGTPTRRRQEPANDVDNIAQERTDLVPSCVGKSRLAEARTDVYNVRKSRRFSNN
ncbi:hypothetical protein NL676_016599 [Syzygium grande]|nr:hypothetical protein NL676_016599 [Syzygium grande]